MDWRAGETDSQTVLLLAEVAAGKPPPYMIAHFGQDAYESYQIAAYMKELIAVRRGEALCWTPGFRLFAETCADMGRKGDLVVEEFGSTLFTLIDKLDRFEVKATYRGVEISKLFRDFAETLHEGRIDHVADWSDFPEANWRATRAYQATSYGFTSTDELAAWIASSAFTLQGVWCASSGEATTQILGKRLHLFNFERLRASLEGQGKTIAVLNNQNYSLRDDHYQAVWIAAFDERIDREAFKERHMRDFGRDVSRDLPDGGEAIPHISGLQVDVDQRTRDDPTFNFGGIGMLDALAQS